MSCSCECAKQNLRYTRVVQALLLAYALGALTVSLIVK